MGINVKKFSLCVFLFQTSLLFEFKSIRLMMADAEGDTDSFQDCFNV